MTVFIEGYAAIFDTVDAVNDIVKPGAFETLNLRKPGSHVPMLWQHDTAKVIGHWTSLREDATGLYAKGELFTDDVRLARQAEKLMREAVVTGLSIGYRALRTEKATDHSPRIIKELVLLEISIVTFPSYEAARVRFCEGMPQNA